MNARRLSDAELSRLTLAELNSGLSCYREDLRYTRADALRAAELWNMGKASTCATVATVDGLPVVVVADAPPGLRPRLPYLFRDVPPGALFEFAGTLYTRHGRTRFALGAHRERVPFRAATIVRMSAGEARGAVPADVVTVNAPGGPELAEYREQWTRHNPGRGIIACRFLIRWRGRWRRLFSDGAPEHRAAPHFIRANGERVSVDWRTP